MLPLLFAAPACAVIIYHQLSQGRSSTLVACGEGAGGQGAGTFELLEKILLPLPMQDILLAQAVSQRFNAVINNSPRIQRALYLSAASNATGSTEVLNPLIFARKQLVFGGVRFIKETGFRIWKAERSLYESNEEFMSIDGDDSGVWNLCHPAPPRSAKARISPARVLEKDVAQSATSRRRHGHRGAEVSSRTNTAG